MLGGRRGGGARRDAMVVRCGGMVGIRASGGTWDGWGAEAWMIQVASVLSRLHVRVAQALD